MQDRYSRRSWSNGRCTGAVVMSWHEPNDILSRTKSGISPIGAINGNSFFDSRRIGIAIYSGCIMARKRYVLTILNYMITSNHIHLLVIDDGDRDVIPQGNAVGGGQWVRNTTSEESQGGLLGRSVSCHGDRERRSFGKMHGLHRHQYGACRCGRPPIAVAKLQLNANRGTPKEERYDRLRAVKRIVGAASYDQD